MGVARFVKLRPRQFEVASGLILARIGLTLMDRLRAFHDLARTARAVARFDMTPNRISRNTMTNIAQLLGDKADHSSASKTRKSPRNACTFPDRILWTGSTPSRTGTTACSATCSGSSSHGRLAGTGYVSILPVDQGIEHSGGASFAKNPDYFDPENIVKLAIEGGCNAVASTFGVLGAVARKYAHKIPFLVKINHNELLTYPNKFDQIMFGTVKQAAGHGRGGGGRDDLFRFRGERPADRRSRTSLRARA